MFFFFLSLFVAVRAEHPEQRPCAKRISNVIKDGSLLKKYGDKAQNVPWDCKERMLDQRPEDADNGPDNSGQKAIVETCKIFVKALIKISPAQWPKTTTAFLMPSQKDSRSQIFRSLSI